MTSRLRVIAGDLLAIGVGVAAAYLVSLLWLYRKADLP